MDKNVKNLLSNSAAPTACQKNPITPNEHGSTTTFAPETATPAHLKEICKTKFTLSKWMNDRCYYFFGKSKKSFDDAQKICSEKFKEHGFNNGKLYEPKNLQNFAKIYELAEQFSYKPTLQIWLGLNDKSKEGEFVYNSNGKQPKLNTPWGGN